MNNILILHGPNLNRLGEREPAYYGTDTLHSLDEQLKRQAHEAGCILSSQQSQSESVLIEAIHQAKEDNIDFLIVNFAAYTHTSIALRDALLCVKIPFIEVHISNIYARETYRHHSYFSDIAHGVITGLGTYGYVLALNAVINTFNK